MNENNESIFNLPNEEIKSALNENIQQAGGSRLSAILNKLSTTFLNNAKSSQENDYKELFEKFIKENEEFFNYIVAANCKIKFSEKFLELQCEPLKLSGKIFIGNDGQFQPDANANAILKHVAEVSVQKNNLESTIDNLEKEGFFPVGELKRQIVNIEGKPTEVMVGVLKNDKGETRIVYFRDGAEVIPDK